MLSEEAARLVPHEILRLEAGDGRPEGEHPGASVREERSGVAATALRPIGLPRIGDGLAENRGGELAVEG